MKWLTLLAAVLIVASAPTLWMAWHSRVQRIEPLAATFMVQNGEYTSPAFVPSKGETYQIQLWMLPPHNALNLHWRVIDEYGTVLASGDCDARCALGNSANAGEYVPATRSPQRVVLQIQTGENYTTTLHVGMPEESLAAGYGFMLGAWWAMLVIAGAVIGVAINHFVIRPAESKPNLSVTGTT